MSIRMRIDVRKGKFAEVTIGYDTCNEHITKNGNEVTWGDWTVHICRSGEREVISIQNAEDPTKNRSCALRDGSLFLDSYAYFRKADYMMFMDQFGLTGIAKMDPNQDYRGQAQEAVDRVSEIEVWSDGDTANLGEDAYGRETYCVSGATWAVCSKHYAVPIRGAIFGSEERYERILYTKDPNPFRLISVMKKAGISAPAVGKAMIG